MSFYSSGWQLAARGPEAARLIILQMDKWKNLYGGIDEIISYICYNYSSANHDAPVSQVVP